MVVPSFIVSEPTNTVVTNGQNAVFVVTAGGDEPLIYQWYFNKTNTLAEATNATLVLSNVAPAQAGSYSVVVANAHGSVTSTPALLSVLVPAFIVSGPTNSVVTNGQNAALAVIAGGDEPLTFQWYFNETNSLADATNATLILNNAAPTQSGSYAVVVANAYGNVTSAPALLNIVVPPTIACSADRRVASSLSVSRNRGTGSSIPLRLQPDLTSRRMASIGGPEPSSSIGPIAVGCGICLVFARGTSPTTSLISWSTGSAGCRAQRSMP